jgi:amino acid transporter
MALIVLVGTETGRGAFDNVLQSVGLTGLPWEDFQGGFATLVAGSAPLYWMLTLLTGVSVFVLRHRDESAERPFTIPLYPVPAIVFCAACAYMLWSSFWYARWLSLVGFVPAACGLAGYLAFRSTRTDSWLLHGMRLARYSRDEWNQL